MKKRNIRVIILISIILILIGALTAYFFTFSGFSNLISSTSTGINGNIATLNDTVADSNYYAGLNYTYGPTTSLPTTENKNIYNDSTLVSVKVSYYGSDIDKTLNSYISLTERQDTLIYHKKYPINNAGTESKDDDYIEIDLIDNPFTDRPTDKGFNGWVTDYSGTTISFDKVFYERKAKVPVKYSGNKATTININFYAAWHDAFVGYVNSSSNWENAFSNLYEDKMVALGGYPVYEDISGFYTKGTLSRLGIYPSNSYDASGNSKSGLCWSSSCEYYSLVGDATYDKNTQYYVLDSNLNTMVQKTVEIIDYIGLPLLPGGKNVGGYYSLITITNGESISGYYDEYGSMYSSSSTCSNANGCDVYRLEQYYNSAGEVNKSDGVTRYYLLPTRDMNIIVMNETVNETWGEDQDKPFTLTSHHNGVSYTDSAKWDTSSLYVTCYNATRIENIKIDTGRTSSASNSPASTTNRNFYGNYQNVKIGRGIVRSGSNMTFNGLLGGNNIILSLGSATNVTRYKLVVESGWYNTVSLTNGNMNINISKYIEAKAVYGNDYDKIINNNDSMEVYFSLATCWGTGNYYASSDNVIAYDSIVKSGKYGTSKEDNTTGIYVGSRGYGNQYVVKRLKFEGGWVYNLMGGPLTHQDKDYLIDSYLYMTGGEADVIYGGAGNSTTHGNKVVMITGGKVNYSVFGGSNSYSSTNEEEEGTLNGSAFVYVGGNATIGNEEYVASNGTIWGAEAGSVFGSGNGNSGSSIIGTTENTNVIIDKDAKILRNVYAGGNYSTTGIASTESDTKSNVKINGGTIMGSLYGGGNKNGAGTDSILSTVNINMNSGTVNGNIYGGSKELGTIRGNVNLDFKGGTVMGSVYGGGQGASTVVSNKVNITYGALNSTSALKVLNNVYGGSEFGTVNTIDKTTKLDDINITVNSGIIEGSLFGGAKGDLDNTPIVAGDVLLTINGGTITNVFGANDKAGAPSGTVNLYLNGGTITNAFGAGNETAISNTNIFVNGSTVTELFGGANNKGNVSLSNIKVTDGNIGTIYGGNNIGGKTTESIISIEGGTTDSIYGGGKLTDLTTTNIEVKSGNITGSLYGGGKNASIDNANILITGGTTNTIYGGSNIEGTADNININLNGGTIETVYGGNNLGGVVNTSKVIVDGSNIGTLYGGGNNVALSKPDVTVNDGIVDNLYIGGNNSAGVTTTNNIELNGGIVNNLYGGGNKASADNVTINLQGSAIGTLYGGGNSAGVTNADINLSSGYINTLYGGANVSGDVNNINISNVPKEIESLVDVNYEYVLSDISDGDYKTKAEIEVTFKNNSNETWNKIVGNIRIDNTTLSSVLDAAFDVTEDNSLYTYIATGSLGPSESYTFKFIVKSKYSKEDFEINQSKLVAYTTNNNKQTSRIEDLKVSNVYGGNNQGGIAQNSSVILTYGEYGNIYGGGNKARLNLSELILNDITVNKNVYGGGNAALVDDNIELLITDSTIKGSVFAGGNAGIISKNTFLNISNTTVETNVYGGGQGETATVMGNSKILIQDSSLIKGHVYGGGKSGNTGTQEEAKSTNEINIVGATIEGNVYGGGKTSVLYGNSVINVGTSFYKDEHVSSDIIINGSIFGGGESNSAGTENYDFSHIGVTNGTVLNIDTNGHDIYKINGSIFGSGNASTTKGESYIYIDNYGTKNDIRKNISIQRADLVSISNSNIELEGATDRTNEYSNILFSFSRIKHLKIKNNTSLYLQSGSNLLEELTSAVDIDGKEVLSNVNIKDGVVTKNTDNNIFLKGGKNLNIAKDENAEDYGKVNGMTFLGLYTLDRNDNIIKGYYEPDEYEQGDTISNADIYLFPAGGYVLATHEANHDITKNGFYSHFETEGIYSVDYIDPTPDDTLYYMWSIGAQVVTYEINLTASKYVTLGAQELGLRNFAEPNSTFSVVDFNYNDLDADINLVNEDAVPRIAETDEKADTVMSLVMKTSNSSWLNEGSTTFMTAEDPIEGTTIYRSDNSTDVPNFVFYLYHSKNLSSTKNLGSVTITLLVETPIDELTSDIERINIVINLNRALYTTNEYEAAITPGKEYGLFANSAVNMTTESSLSAYYSLYLEGDKAKYQDGYHRTLVSSYVLPINTRLTLINLNEDSVNEYYYFVIDEDDYNKALEEYNEYHECSYDFSNFVRMGSTSKSNIYQDELNNSKYYNKDTNTAYEEFIVQVDFSESDITENVLNKTLLIELRSKDNRTVINVLGIQQEKMKYSLYKESNATIDVDGNISKQIIYPGETVFLNVNTNFVKKQQGTYLIDDTDYFEQQLGIKISYYDENGKVVTGASLLGVTYEYEGIKYYPRMDGSVRIRLAQKMANVSSKIKIHTTEKLASGNYTMKIESFGSADGIYFGEVSTGIYEVPFTVLDNVYGLSMSMGDYIFAIDNETGNNLNQNNELKFNIKYVSALNNPKLRISLQRRMYQDIYSTEYELVDLRDYISDALTETKTKNEYLLADTPLKDINYTFNFKNNLKTGTYKLVVSLYDSNNYIGEVYKYIIIKEKYDE